MARVSHKPGAEDAPALIAKDISKAFGAVVAAQNCSFSVDRGELVALLGPSGCGKTTLLNMIAGFETPDAGEIMLNGRSITELPPHKRETGMVFQQYALFPHMKVRGNIAYGLEARKVDAKEVDRQIKQLVKLLKLDGLENRYPNELSGGQKQRVAVARALAIRPEVILLDEAFSALDKNLREEMQIELTLLLRRLGITTILVTHDQREAFTVADRIIVMEGGKILQMGTPQELYQSPKSSFVLEFLGSVNQLRGQVKKSTRGGGKILTEIGLVLPLKPRSGYREGDRVKVFVRAEHVDFQRKCSVVHTKNPANVDLVTFLGASRRVVASLNGVQLISDQPVRSNAPALPKNTPVFVNVSAENIHVLGDEEAIG